VGSSSFGMADEGGGEGPFRQNSEVNESEHGRGTNYNRYPSNQFVVKL